MLTSWLILRIAKIQEETRLKDEEGLRSAMGQEALGCQHCVVVTVFHTPGGLATASRVSWEWPCFCPTLVYSVGVPASPILSPTYDPKARYLREHMLDVIASTEGTGVQPSIKTSTRVNFPSTGRVGLDAEMLFQRAMYSCWVD